MVVLSSIKVDMNIWSLREARAVMKELGLKASSTSFDNDICLYNQKDVLVLESKGYNYDGESKIMDGLYAIFHLNQDNDENEPSKRSLLQQIKNGGIDKGSRVKSPRKCKSPTKIKSPSKVKSPRRTKNKYEDEY